IKVLLAKELVTRFHSAAAADAAEAEFDARFRGGAIPDDILEFSFATEGKGMGIAQLIKQAGLVSSTSEANRNIEQGGVKLDGEKVEDRARVIAPGTVVVVQVGKRKWARVSLT
ncbi:MAG: S4 domain-containing protein, partial [Burkholderiaceae bacterium]